MAASPRHLTQDGKSATLSEPASLLTVQGLMDPKNPTEIHDSHTQIEPISGFTNQINVDLIRCEK